MEQVRNIAILCHASAGGSGVVATELGIALAELGHNIHIVSTERPFRLTDDRVAIRGEINRFGLSSEQPKGIWSQFIDRSRESVSHWMRRLGRPVPQAKGKLMFHQIQGSDYPLFKEPMTTLTAANALAQVIEKYKIEIVHAHYAIPHATSAIMARDMGLPVKVVTTLHGTDVTLVGQDPSFALTTKHAILNSDAVTAVSKSLAEDACKYLGIQREIRVVYNWVDTERFQPNGDPKNRLKYAQPDEAILMHVSNFRPIKRPQDVIKAFAGVVHERPARLLMVGDGPLRQECQKLAQVLELAGRVQFIDFTPAIEKFMAVADVFLLPSENESFGLVALEAMASGVPVVANRVGGLPEVVTDNRSGYLTEVGDTQAMTQAILQILDNPARRKQMGEAARMQAIESFRPEQILPQYLEVYQSVLESKGQLTLVA